VEVYGEKAVNHRKRRDKIMSALKATAEKIKTGKYRFKYNKVETSDPSI
jgi:hypothetical protein